MMYHCRFIYYNKCTILVGDDDSGGKGWYIQVLERMCVCECVCLKTKRKYFATIIVIILNSILSWFLHFLWSIPKANFQGFFLWMWYCNSKSVTQILINPCDFYQKKFLPYIKGTTHWFVSPHCIMPSSYSWLVILFTHHSLF